MSSQALRRTFLQITRRNVQRTTKSLQLSSRRGMASSSGPEKSSDLPWMIGSGLVTGLVITYILSPRSKKHAHEAAKSAKAPIEHALPKREKEPDLMKDDEGNVEDISESTKRSFEADNPKDAKAAEAAASRFNDGAPGQTDDAETPEVKEKPAGTPRAGTLQDKAQGPTDLGDARQQAKEKKAPKEVAETTES